MPGNWVGRPATEERRKDQTRTREAAAAIHHSDVVRFRLQCLMVDLKNRVARHVEAIARELPDRRLLFALSTLDERIQLVPLFSGHSH